MRRFRFKIISSNVVIDGITAPVIGAKPDYTADIYDTRYAQKDTNDARTKNGITWYKDGIAMYTHTPFEAGHTYSVVVAVTAADGFTFGNAVPGTINGQPVELISGDEYNLYYEYVFSAAEQPSVSAAAGAVSADTVTIVVTGNTGGQSADLYIAVYDADGRMIGIEKAEGQTPTGGSSEHSVTFDGLADLASVFLLNTDGVPYSGSASIDLR